MKDLIVLFCLGWLVSQPALACRPPMNETPIMFDEVPAVPDGTFIARVKVLRYVSLDEEGFIEAETLSVLSNHPTPKRLLLSYHFLSSCDREPQVGELGIIAGKVLSDTDGEMRVYPYRAFRQQGGRVEAGEH